MLQRSARFALAIVLALSLAPMPAYAADSQPSWADEIDTMLLAGNYVEGQVVVGIDPVADSAFDLSKLLFGSLLGNRTELIEVAADSLQGANAGSPGTVIIAKIESDDMTTWDLLKALADEPAVVFAEPNYVAGLAEEDGADAGLAPVDSGIRSSAVGESDALGRSPYDFTDRQWSFASEAGCNPPRWNDADGNMASDVAVAVLDAGVDAGHPDLEGSLFEFDGGMQASLGCDAHGFDALSGRGGSEDSDPIGHGTNVAGVIAAQWNDFGISGIASGAKVMSVRVAASDGTETLADCLRGYRFVADAVSKGVSVGVIANSWKGFYLSRALNAASYELGANFNAISVFAAGNDGFDLDAAYQPAPGIGANPYAIVVAGISDDGTLWPSSNYGANSVNFGAPAAVVLSTASSEFNAGKGAANLVSTEDYGSYYSASGTSLAAAAVAGGAAVLASGYQEATGKLPPALMLASQVMSSARYESSLSGKTRTDGTFDMSMSRGFRTLAGDPAISSIAVEGTTVTVDGENFGNSQGHVQAVHGELGDGETVANVSGVDKWTDGQVVFSLADDPYGILDVTVFTTSDASCTESVFVSPGPTVYEEQTLKNLPKTSDLVSVPNVSDVDAGGILQGDDGYLYYLREIAVDDGAGGYTLGYRTLERYSVSGDTWETLASLPEWLEYCSAAIKDGVLYVCGVSMDESGSGAPVEPATLRERVYSYDPNAGSWSACSASGVSPAAGIVNDGGQLKVIGGIGDYFLDTIYEYSPEKGAGSKVATLAMPVAHPQAVVNDGNLYVYSYGTSLADWSSQSATPYLQIVSGNAGIEYSNPFPAFKSKGSDEDYPVDKSANYGSIAASANGLVLVGPVAADGAADTFVMPWDGSSFAPYAKRASDARPIGAAAAVYLGKLYAASSSLIEPDNQVFRATRMLDADVKSGNYSVWRRGSTDPVVIVYTPDLDRFSHKVVVDEVDLVEGIDYTVQGEPTTISIRPDFLSKLGLGTHTVTAYFDDERTTVVAYFTIEEAASPIDGRTRPASLARTDDSVPVGAAIVIGAGAVIAAVMLLRKRLPHV